MGFRQPSSKNNNHARSHSLEYEYELQMRAHDTLPSGTKHDNKYPKKPPYKYKTEKKHQ
jgi:hypothetical protein